MSLYSGTFLQPFLVFYDIGAINFDAKFSGKLIIQLS